MHLNPKSNRIFWHHGCFMQVISNRKIYVLSWYLQLTKVRPTNAHSQKLLSVFFMLSTFMSVCISMKFFTKGLLREFCQKGRERGRERWKLWTSSRFSCRNSSTTSFIFRFSNDREAAAMIRYKKAALRLYTCSIGKVERSNSADFMM